MNSILCENCSYYQYEEEFDEYYCDVALDDDEMARFLAGNIDHCPFFNPYDEYKTVRKQN